MGSKISSLIFYFILIEKMYTLYPDHGLHSSNSFHILPHLPIQRLLYLLSLYIFRKQSGKLKNLKERKGTSYTHMSHFGPGCDIPILAPWLQPLPANPAVVRAHSGFSFLYSIPWATALPVSLEACCHPRQPEPVSFRDYQFYMLSQKPATTRDKQANKHHRQPDG